MGRRRATPISSWTPAARARRWSVGDTPDPDGAGAPAHPGFMTRGHPRPARRTTTGACSPTPSVPWRPSARTPRSTPSRDRGDRREPGRRAVASRSAALVPTSRRSCRTCRSCATSARAIELADSDPYAEVARYLRSTATRSSRRSRRSPTSTARSSADGRRRRRCSRSALMDEICPPSTVYAAYNAYGGPRRSASTRSTTTRAARPFHEVVQMGWLRERL